MQKNKLKLKITAAAASLLLAATSVSAAISGETSGNTVNIDFNSETSGLGTVVYVLKGALDSDAVIDESCLKQNLYLTFVANGESFAFDFPEGTEDGVYTVVAGISAPVKDRVYYAIKISDDVLAAALDDIKAQADADSFFEKISEYNGEKYFIDLKSAESSKKLLFDLFGKQSFDGVEGLKKLVEDASAIGGIKSESAEKIADILKSYASVLGISGGDNPDAESVALAAAKIRAEGAKAETLEDLRKLAAEAEAVAAYNGSGDVIEVIKSYNQVFGVDFSYKGYSSVSEYELKKLLRENAITRAAEVKPLFEKSVDKLAAEQRENTGGNSGNSGGSGGGGGGSRGGSSGGGNGYSGPLTLDNNVIGKSEDKAVFKDIEGFEWANEAISYLSYKNIMQGDGNGLFRPDDYITREEFVKIVAALFCGGETSERELEFKDVKSGEWYEQFIAVSVDKGFIKGISEDMFGIGSYVSRQDAAVIMKRIIDTYKIEYSVVKSKIDFADFESVDDYAEAAVDYLARIGIINGYEDSTFRPEEPITRAQAAKIVYESSRNF